MILADKVNAIWDALPAAMESVEALGDKRILHALPLVSREEVLEAWLYQLIQRVVEAEGVRPLPPTRPS